MTKRNSLRALGLSAAIIVGAGGSLAASPAFAAKPTVDPASAKVGQEVEDMGALGYGPGADGKLIVMVDAKDKKAATALSDFESDHKNVEVIELKDGIQPMSDRDVVGGAGYYASTDQSIQGAGGLCSTGFAAWGPNGEESVITAGHCASTAAGTYKYVGMTDPKTDLGAPAQGELHEGEIFGEFVMNQWGGKDDPYAPKEDPTVTDIAVIKKTNDKYNLKPEVTDWTTKDSRDLSKSTTKIRSVGTAKPNMQVKRSGRTTGQHDGKVLTEANFKFKVADDPDGPGGQEPKERWVTGFAATNHSDRGDSGGAWFNDAGEALGVLSAGGLDTETNKHVSLVTDINHGLKQTGGYQVRLFVDAPKIENATVKPGATVSGTTESNAQAGVGGNNIPDDFNAEPGKFSFKAPEEPGKYEYSFFAKKGHYDISEATKVTITVSNDDPTSTPSPTATDDPTSTPSPTATDDPTDDPVKRSLDIDPENIKAADFVKKDAVQIVATGCTPETEAKLEVKPRGSNVTGHTDTATVDKDGNVGFSVYGENADMPNAYVGDYDVTVTCDGGDALKGSFTVSKTGEKDDDGKGGDDGKDNDDLPRTGSEALSSLGIAAALVAGGAGLYVLARRRKN